MVGLNRVQAVVLVLALLAGPGSVQRAGAPRTVRLSDATVQRLAEAGKPNLKAGIVGLLIGGVAGGLAGCAANRDDYGVFCGGQSDLKVAVGAGVGGIIGGVAGALLFRHK